MTKAYRAIFSVFCGDPPPLAGEASTLDNTLVQIGGIIINGWLLGYLRAETTRSLFASAKHLQQQVK